jgi:hypothetical protein
VSMCAKLGRNALSVDVCKKTREHEPNDSQHVRAIFLFLKLNDVSEGHERGLGCQRHGKG